MRNSKSERSVSERQRAFYQRRPKRYRRNSSLLVLGGGVVVGAMLGAASLSLDWPSNSSLSVPVTARPFTICHTGGGTNCVVDGDTAWIDGAKVRVADIDAPETHPARCATEQELGDRATKRLAELLNAGAFELVPAERDTDKYGRKLRTLERNGRSIGGQLVSEGLARKWEGQRRPWC